MKVIDLLNKIANEEKVPKKIRIRGVYYPDFDENGKYIDKEDLRIWELNTDYHNYKDYYCENESLFGCLLINRCLNDEIEVVK